MRVYDIELSDPDFEQKIAEAFDLDNKEAIDFYRALLEADEVDLTTDEDLDK